MKQRIVGLITLAGMSLLGCRPDEIVSTSPDNRVSLEAFAGLASKWMPTLDQEFERLSAEVPGFAGLGFDDQHTLVLHMTSEGVKDQALVPIRAFLVRSHRTEPDALMATMYVRSAKYTFGQLAEWTRAFTHAVRSQKLTYVDIDERLNRISIGASDLSTATELQRLGESLAIPVDAFSTEIRGATASDATLQQTYRPIYGSLKIVIYGPGNGCTIGYSAFVAYGDYGATVDSSEAYVTTSSHCMEHPYTNDTGQYWCQVDCTVKEGLLAVDPNTWSYPNDPFVGSLTSCPNNGASCRYSDAALMHIDSASFWHATMGVTCSGITLCDSYSIVSTTQPMYGDDAKFEGQISGYSHGQVVNTCTSVLQGGTSKTLLCQYEAYYTSVAGDSGGPVVTGCGSPCYFTDYNPVRAIGQSVGHNSTYTFLGQFSWIGMVYNELGQGAGGTGLRLTRY